MLYLETGCIPFREIIRKRRILYLQYIMNEKPNSILRKFLKKQIETKKKKDWINQVFTDLKELNLNITVESISKIQKTTLKIILNEVIEQKTFRDLEKKKESHSKVRNIKYLRLEMQKYLNPNDSEIKIEEAQEIFKMRSRVSNVKTNFKGNYQSFECKVCKIEDETQQHVIKCKAINEIRENYKKPPEYEELYKSNVEKQVNLVQHFLENIKIKEKFNR